MPTRQIAYWVMPPEQDAALVACMEDVLATYYPVILNVMDTDDAVSSVPS